MSCASTCSVRVQGIVGSGVALALLCFCSRLVLVIESERGKAGTAVSLQVLPM